MQQAAETAARLLHEMRQQAGAQDSAATLQRKADTLQEICGSVASSLTKLYICCSGAFGCFACTDMRW